MQSLTLTCFSPTQVYNSRISTARCLSQAITRSTPDQRPKVFVQITGVGFYPYDTPSLQDESSTGGSHDFMARLVKDWEEAARVPKELGVRNVYIRSGEKR